MRSDYVDVTVVLDRSGSMQNIARDMEGGFATFIREQKQVPGEMRVNLYQFDNVYETVYENRNVHDINGLTLEPRGSTALMDALGHAINRTGARLAAMPEHERPHRVIFMIITDGGENASREFGRDAIRQMIERQQGQYSWQFVYLGANQNAFAEAGNIGIKTANTMNFAANSRSTNEAYKNFSGKMSTMRAGGHDAEVLCSAGMYNQADYDAQTAAGAVNNPTTSGTTAEVGQFAPWVNPDGTVSVSSR